MQMLVMLNKLAMCKVACMHTAVKEVHNPCMMIPSIHPEPNPAKSRSTMGGTDAGAAQNKCHQKEGQPNQGARRSAHKGNKPEKLRGRLG